MDGTAVGRHHKAGEDPETYSARLFKEAQQIDVQAKEKNRARGVKNLVFGDATIVGLLKDAVSKGIRNFNTLQSSSYFGPHLQRAIQTWKSRHGTDISFGSEHHAHLKELFQELVNEAHYQVGKDEYDETHAQDPSFDTPEQAEAREKAKNTPYGIIKESEQEHKERSGELGPPADPGVRSRHGSTFDPLDALVHQYDDDDAEVQREEDFHKVHTGVNRGGGEVAYTESSQQVGRASAAATSGKLTRKEYIRREMEQLRRMYPDADEDFIERREQELEATWGSMMAITTPEYEDGQSTGRRIYTHTTLDTQEEVGERRRKIESPDLPGFEVHYKDGKLVSREADYQETPDALKISQAEQFDRNNAQRQVDNDNSRRDHKNEEKLLLRHYNRIKETQGQEAADTFLGASGWKGNQHEAGHRAHTQKMDIAEGRPVLIGQMLDIAIESGDLKLTPEQKDWWRQVKADEAFRAGFFLFKLVPEWKTKEGMPMTSWQNVVQELVPAGHPLRKQITDLTDDKVRDFLKTIEDGAYYEEHGLLDKNFAGRFLGDSAGQFGLDYATLGGGDVMGLTRGNFSKWIDIYNNAYQSAAEKARQKYIDEGGSEEFIEQERALGNVGHIFLHLLGPTGRTTRLPLNKFTALNVIPKIGPVSGLSFKMLGDIAIPIAVATNKSASSDYQAAKDLGASDRTAAWISANTMASEVVTELVGAAIGYGYFRHLLNGMPKAGVKNILKHVVKATFPKSIGTFFGRFGANAMEEVVAELWVRTNHAGWWSGLPIDPDAMEPEQIKKGMGAVMRANFWFSLVNLAQGKIGSVRLQKKWKEQFSALQEMTMADPNHEGRVIINKYLKVQFQEWMDDNPNADHAKVFSQLFPLFAEIVASSKTAATRAIANIYYPGQPQNYKTSKQRTQFQEEVREAVISNKKADSQTEALIEFAIEAEGSRAYTIEAEQDGKPVQVVVHAPTEQAAVDRVADLRLPNGEAAFQIPEQDIADPVAQESTTEQKINRYDESQPYVVTVYNEDTGVTSDVVGFARNETEAVNLLDPRANTRVEGVRLAEEGEVNILGRDSTTQAVEQTEDIPVSEELDLDAQIAAEADELDASIEDDAEEQWQKDLDREYEVFKDEQAETGEVLLTEEDPATQTAEELEDPIRDVESNANQWTEDESSAKEAHALSTLQESHGENVELTPALTREQSRAQELAERLGLRLVFYSGAEANQRGGTIEIDGKTTGVIAVNIGQQGEALWRTVGHEIAHGTTLDRMGTHLGITQEDIETIWKRKLKRLKPHQRQAYEAASRKKKSLIQREAVAQYVEAMFLDPNFRNEVIETNPGFVRKVLEFITGIKPTLSREQRNVIDTLRRLVNKGEAGKTPVATYTEIHSDLEELTPEQLNERAEELDIPATGKTTEVLQEAVAQEELDKQTIENSYDTVEAAEAVRKDQSSQLSESEKEEMRNRSNDMVEEAAARLRGSGLIRMEDPAPTEDSSSSLIKSEGPAGFEEFKIDYEKLNQHERIVTDLAAAAVNIALTGDMSLDAAVFDVLDRAGLIEDKNPISFKDRELAIEKRLLKLLVMEEAQRVYKSSKDANPSDVVESFRRTYSATSHMMDLLQRELDLNPLGAPSTRTLEKIAREVLGGISSIEVYTNAVIRLAGALQENSRPLTADEQAGFFFVLNHLADKVRVLSKRLVQAEKDGLSQDRIGTIASQLQVARDQLEGMQEANKSAGTEWSQAGFVRGALGRLHLQTLTDVESLMAEARNAKHEQNRGELTPSEERFVRRIAKEYEDIIGKIETEQVPVVDRQATDAIRSKNPKTRKPRAKPKSKRVGDAIANLRKIRKPC